MAIDYSTYPPDWKKRSEFIRKYRAKNRCEICGQAHSKKTFLTVMHLAHDLNKSSLLDLAAGCPRCHNNYDTEFRKQNRTGEDQVIKTISLNDIDNKKLLPNYFHLFRKRKTFTGQLSLFKL